MRQHIIKVTEWNSFVTLDWLKIRYYVAENRRAALARYKAEERVKAGTEITAVIVEKKYSEQKWARYSAMNTEK
ncbi:hypothetical protein [Ktedonobacter racemifer]|uniref:Uncharacterized protein n=1 Tax=Ktedonobacter racemifer DSM 44963 TaxID=485913 RepID=D6U903_KTERA|nr:hypothetical protein [Ktedonobacter racemifer]EFH79558.1 hypothetical protein Krac_0068 [Ktedonobacter racemifer DSM 44963]